MIGMPPHIYDHDIAQAIVDLAKLLVNQADICEELGISASTMNRYYLKDYWRGRRSVIKIIQGKAISRALAGNDSMIALILKTQAGWAERRELTGPGGAPIQTQNFDFSVALEGKTVEELDVLIPFLEQIVSGSGRNDPGGGEGAAGAGEDA